MFVVFSGAKEPIWVLLRQVAVKKALVLQTETLRGSNYPLEFNSWQEWDSLQFSEDAEKIKCFNSCKKSYKFFSYPSTIQTVNFIHIIYCTVWLKPYYDLINCYARDSLTIRTNRTLSCRGTLIVQLLIGIPWWVRLF